MYPWDQDRVFGLSPSPSRRTRASRVHRVAAGLPVPVPSFPVGPVHPAPGLSGTEVGPDWTETGKSVRSGCPDEDCHDHREWMYHREDMLLTHPRRRPPPHRRADRDREGDLGKEHRSRPSPVRRQSVRVRSRGSSLAGTIECYAGRPGSSVGRGEGRGEGGRETSEVQSQRGHRDPLLPLGPG